MKEGEVHLLQEYEVHSGEHHYSFGMTTKLGMLAIFWYSVEDGESRVQFMETMKRNWLCRYQWYIRTRIWIARKKFINSLKVIEAINIFIGESDEISIG